MAKFGSASVYSKSKSLVYAPRRNRSVGKATSSTSYSSSPRQLRGPELAEHLFNDYSYDDECVEGSCEDYEEKLTDEPYQLTLDLEPIQDYEAKLRELMVRYDSAYKRMATSALKWKQLMDDVEENPNIKELFENMQLMRRLSGSNFE